MTPHRVRDGRGERTEVVHGFEQLKESPKRPVVVTIGNFDGVHRGHQRIISMAIQQARGLQGTAVAFTFRPHPQVALRPEKAPPLLMTYDEKLELLAEQGVDLILEQPFSREFSTSAPETFFNEVLLRRLNASSIVVGYDFAFGKGREGHLEALSDFCQRSGVKLTVVEPQRFEGEVVSSSRIRTLLSGGQVLQASRLLGRPFFYRGVVIKGDARGRKLGFPTANLRLENKIALPNGVYATVSRIRDARGNWLESESFIPSVTNIGVRPTFTISAAQQAPMEGEFPALIETHLLGRSLDLYGLTLEVRFLERLREERKFDGLEALKSQIARDAEAARLKVEEWQKGNG
jgi:riboflavin kinase/FMN adenylyltransferase